VGGIGAEAVVGAGGEAAVQPGGIIGGTVRGKGAFHRFVYRVELMVWRYFLCDDGTVVVEGDEIEDEVEEPVFVLFAIALLPLPMAPIHHPFCQNLFVNHNGWTGSDTFQNFYKSI